MSGGVGDEVGDKVGAVTVGVGVGLGEGSWVGLGASVDLLELLLVFLREPLPFPLLFLDLYPFLANTLSCISVVGSLRLVLVWILCLD